MGSGKGGAEVCGGEGGLKEGEGRVWWWEVEEKKVMEEEEEERGE